MIIKIENIGLFKLCSLMLEIFINYNYTRFIKYINENEDSGGGSFSSCILGTN